MTSSGFINRRRFLSGIAAAGGALWAGAGAVSAPAQAPRGKAPFRLLYGNDTTNLEECVSPFHKKGQAFGPQMIAASVDEAADAGADAQLLQPGLMWVPLWKSKVYPADAHFRSIQKEFGVKLPGLGQYMVDGGDVVQVFVDRCRRRGTAAFVSVRLNDYHRVEALDARAGDKLEQFDTFALDAFRRSNPEYRLGPGSMPAAPATREAKPLSVFQQREQNVLNWVVPQVRERLFALITELCENYDIDGLELDFLRHFRLFRASETTRAQRTAIVTEFVAKVRALLNRTTRKGRPRWLCVRVPAPLEVHDALGIDLLKLTQAGVDMVNLSSNYYTVQQGIDWPAIRRLAPTAAIYVEMTHCTMVGGRDPRSRGDAPLFRRTTAEQFLTTADLAYARGADGISLFNFAYYREVGDPRRGPFSEPPFEAIRHLADRTFLTGAPRHYFLSPAWRSPYGNSTSLPRIVGNGRAAKFTLDLAPPAQGWPHPARLRLQSEAPIGEGLWHVLFNGVAVQACNDVSEPYPTLSPSILGNADTLRAWTIPAELLRSGKNAIGVTFTGAVAAKLVFIDLAV